MRRSDDASHGGSTFLVVRASGIIEYVYDNDWKMLDRNTGNEQI
jgi:hypothetical protein